MDIFMKTIIKLNVQKVPELILHLLKLLMNITKATAYYF